MEAALGDMRFERPAYDGGTVALVTGVALPREARVTVEIEGDFMSLEAPTRFAIDLPAGEKRLPIADTDDLPADFRHFKVTLDIGGHAVSRVFGVEI